MDDKIERKNNPVNKIEYYFLRISIERLASDLQEFSAEISTFSDEQLYAIIGRYEYIEDSMRDVKKELERRLEIDNGEL